MDTFGVTAHGVPSEIGFACNPGYCEAREQLPRQPGCAKDRWVDGELLRGDGRSLASNWRMMKQRIAHVRDPCVTTAMDIGWSLVDPALCGAHFPFNDMRNTLVMSDVFRTWHERMLHTGGDVLQMWTRKPVDMAEITPKVRCVVLPAKLSNARDAPRMDKPARMQTRESQILEGGGAPQLSLDTEAGRMQYQEKQRQEARKKRAQQEGSRILRAQMERLRDRKDMQPHTVFNKL